MTRIFSKFLEMLDFSQEEISELSLDFELATKNVGLTASNIKYAMDLWIPQNWDITLKGVRLCIGAFIREFIDVSRVKKYKDNGIKVIYGMSPSQANLFQAIKISGKDKIFVSYPDFLYSIVVGGFFDRIDLLNDDDDKLSVRCRHCTLNRVRINCAMERIIPEPDVIWSWGLYCDEAPKTEELISCMTNGKWRYITVRIPHDTFNGEEEDKNYDRVRYLSELFKESHREISELTGISITNQDMYDALVENSKYCHKIDQLTRLVSNSDPQPVGGNELALFGITNFMMFNTGYLYFEKAIDCMLSEVKHRVDNGIGILPKGSPKLGCHFTPVCVPWIDRTFMENGVSICFSSHFSYSKKQFMPYDYADPYMMAAQIWFRTPSSVNSGYQIELTAEMIKEYDIDGMLYGFFTFDRWLGSNQNMILKRIEEETNVQHFYIEGDFWDDTNFKKSDRKGRIQSIAYFLKARKLMTSKVYAESMKKQEKGYGEKQSFK